MNSVFQFFISKATVEDIEKFCEKQGYGLWIFDQEHFSLVREVPDDN